MTHQAFEALVRKLEARYASRPRLLRWVVFGWLLLGFAGFLSWFLLLIPLGIAGLVGGAALPISAGIWLLLIGGGLLLLGTSQLLWLVSLRPNPSTGRILRRGEAPAFDRLLDELRQAQRCGPFHRVLVTIEFNASVSQVPRLGVFGWSWNELHIGLPLLEVVSPEEIRAVLAHEIAHVSAVHGRFGHSMYRLRLTWEQLFARLFHDQSTATRWDRVLVTKFVSWYWPRFNARAFVLSRFFEYEADARSAEAAGADAAASALWRIDCVGRLLSEKFWPDVWKRANAEPEPPRGVLRQLAQAASTAPDAAEAATWMDQISRTLTDNLDTHPSPADRLENLGVPIEEFRARGFYGRVNRPAAPQLLAECLEALRDDVEENWRKQVAQNWRDRHARAGSLQHRLDRLHQTVSDLEGTPAALWQKAQALLDLEGPEAAEPILRKLLEIDPKHSAGRYVLGCHLIDRGQPEGESLLWDLVETEEDELVPRACDALAAHFRASGQSDGLQEIRQYLDRYEAAVAASQKERSTVSAGDRFLSHDLSDEQLETVLATLREQPDFGEAWLVRKHLVHFPRQPLYVLCVRAAQGGWGWFRSAEKDQQLAARLISKVKLPGRVLVLAPAGGFRALGRTVMRIPEAQIA